mmetsp:Transcript_46999/g.123318  ORF Transcript_46999/g.123318 Transcript_46999/m.123318 type:complete len:113 (-) Transcript_46999:18-356(-)
MRRSRRKRKSFRSDANMCALTGSHTGEHGGSGEHGGMAGVEQTCCGRVCGEMQLTLIGCDSRPAFAAVQGLDERTPLLSGCLLVRLERNDLCAERADGIVEAPLLLAQPVQG